VLVVGAGTMGEQIGLQCAIHGFATAIHDLSDSALDRCRAGHRRIADSLMAGRGMPEEVVSAALARLTYTTDLAAACADVDLVIESVPEIPTIKAETYARLNELCPPRTIFTTNSSTLLPSQLAEATGRPERFLALHFANPVWEANIGEVMGHTGTDPVVFERVLRFAREIGLVPIRLDREQGGYVINSLLVPLLAAAQTLVSNGVTTPENVDRTWMIATKMVAGPFGIMDRIGLETIYNVTSYWAERKQDEQLRRNASYVKTRFLDRGKLGVKTGEGFYTYPEPAFRNPGFLS
jgi:3-hydroxybutyryl-CoA dehydrogenase